MPETSAPADLTSPAPVLRVLVAGLDILSVQSEGDRSDRIVSDSARALRELRGAGLEVDRLAGYLATIGESDLPPVSRGLAVGRALLGCMPSITDRLLPVLGTGGIARLSQVLEQSHANYLTGLLLSSLNVSRSVSVGTGYATVASYHDWNARPGSPIRRLREELCQALDRGAPRPSPPRVGQAEPDAGVPPDPWAERDRQRTAAREREKELEATLERGLLYRLAGYLQLAAGVAAAVAVIGTCSGLFQGSLTLVGLAWAMAAALAGVAGVGSLVRRAHRKRELDRQSSI